MGETSIIQLRMQCRSGAASPAMVTHGCGVDSTGVMSLRTRTGTDDFGYLYAVLRQPL